MTNSKKHKIKSYVEKIIDIYVKEYFERPEDFNNKITNAISVATTMAPLQVLLNLVLKKDAKKEEEYATVCAKDYADEIYKRLNHI